jgi:hypothetical protein
MRGTKGEGSASEGYPSAEGRGANTEVLGSQAPTAQVNTGSVSDATVSAAADAIEQVRKAHATYGEAVSGISKEIGEKVREALAAYQRAQLEWSLNPGSRENLNRAAREYQMSGIKAWTELGAAGRAAQAYRDYRHSLSGLLTSEGAAHPRVATQTICSLSLVSNYQAYLEAVDRSIPKN